MPKNKALRRNYGKRRMRKRPMRTQKRKPTTDKVITRDLKFLCKTALTTYQDCLLGNAQGSITAGNIYFKPINMPGFDLHAKVFEFFRIDKIWLEFIPVSATQQIVDAGVGTQAGSLSRVTPIFYLSRIYGNEPASSATWLSETEAIYTASKRCKITSPAKISWVPNVLMLGAQTREGMLASMSANQVVIDQAFSAVKKKWVSVRDEYTPFYGVKWLISNTASFDNEFCYKVIAKVRISFKGKVDTINSLSDTVIMNYTN